jgi:hypothetical protein
LFFYFLQMDFYMQVITFTYRWSHLHASDHIYPLKRIRWLCVCVCVSACIVSECANIAGFITDLHLWGVGWLIDCNWVWGLAAPMHIGLNWQALCAPFRFKEARLPYHSSRPPRLTFLISSGYKKKEP